jgi:hypothetical protein
MKHFQTEAESKVSQVEQLQVKSDELFQKTVSFYGENVQTVQSNEFFKIFHTFITSWQVKRYMHMQSVSLKAQI